MCEFLPVHTSTEIEALREDLKANGLKVQVVIDENGGVIDGRLRAKLCDELKIDWRQTARVESGLTDDQKAALRIRLNLLRRNTPPTASQRRECVRTLLKADAKLSNGTIAKLCGMDPSNVSRIRSEMVKKGEAQTADVTIGVDDRTRQKPPRSERPRITPKATSEHPSTGETVQILQLPQAPICAQANPLPSAVVQPDAEEPVVLNQPVAANESPVEADEGCLDCSSLKLKLVQAVSVRNGCWEWLAKDEQGNRYLISCRRVEMEARKVG
jgi:hypothetical protein